jgi:SNF2 family DNA or RNA helicase
LRLRQACCDLRLFQKPAPDDPMDLPEFPAANVPAVVDSSVVPGGKVQMFGELLDEILDGGHRVLVFSQFTSMLHLLRDELKAREIACSYLDGQTRDRAAVVNEFQNNAGIPVFLISLKAGGVGLNLTGADTVIHFDPWWNPAVEDQATDRAHRIGQTRSVTSYKLIARNTVEEKILHLQQKKRQLAGAALSGEDGVAESLSWEEIRELFA